MLTYETLVQEAYKSIPVFADKYDKMVSKGYFDDTTGKHIVFSWAFVPVLKDAIEHNNKDLTDIMMGFLESMASSEDHLVQEVCDFTILEELFDQLPADKLYPLLGHYAKEGYRAISEYMIAG